MTFLTCNWHTSVKYFLHKNGLVSSSVNRFNKAAHNVTCSSSLVHARHLMGI